MNQVMNMRTDTCGGEDRDIKRSKPKRKCPPAPPSSPRRPPRCDNDPPPQWIPMNTPPMTPTPMDSPNGQPEYFDGAGPSWASAFGDSLGFWDANAEGTPAEKSLYFGEAPAFLTALPLYRQDDSIGGPPPKIVSNVSNVSNASDFASDEDDDDFADDDDDDDDDEPPPKTSKQTHDGTKEPPLDGATFAADMAVYVASGILLIFVMEQFIQMGMKMR